jgi:hypothetical protein
VFLLRKISNAYAEIAWVAWTLPFLNFGRRTGEKLVERREHWQKWFDREISGLLGQY